MISYLIVQGLKQIFSELKTKLNFKRNKDDIREKKVKNLLIFFNLKDVIYFEYICK